jgi:hypothetical protein
VLLDVGGFVDPAAKETLPEMTHTEGIDFGGVIRLRGYRLNGNDISLLWEASGTPDDNYTVFVQVLDADGQIVGQGDAPPILPTRYWRSGEQYVTAHTLYYPETPPDGDYQVVIGWYSPDDFARLETDYPDSAYPLTTITIP